MPIKCIHVLRSTALLFSFIIIASCDDNDDFNNLSPFTQINYPPYASVTETDQITVRGNAADVHGVSSVRVNGIPVTTSDEYANWEVNVPLVDGVNTLVVSATDGTGFTGGASSVAYVAKKVQYGNINALVEDSANNRLLLLDEARDELIAFDLTTQLSSVISGLDTPDTITPLINPTDVSFGALASTVYVTDASLQAIIAVDLTTGSRSVLSSNTVPDGNNPFSNPTSIAYDPTLARLIVTDAGSDQLLAVDMTSGARSVIADFSGLGGANDIGALDIDTANNRAIFTDTNISALIAVDLASGVRTVISDLTTPNASNPLSLPVDLQVDVANQLAYLADIVEGYIQVDLSDGSRTPLPIDAGVSDGSGILWSNTLQLDTANNTLHVASRNDIFETNITTGAIFPLAFSATPSYFNSFYEGQSLALTDSERTVVIYDSATEELVYLDSGSGARFGSSGNPGNPPITLSDTLNPTSIVLDGLNNRGILSPAPPSILGPPTTPDAQAIVAIGYFDGARTTLSNNAAPDASNPFTGISDITRHGETQLLALDNGANAILSVDLTSGARNILSSPSVPDGNNTLSDATLIAVDSDNDVGYVVDQGLNAVLAVNLTSGARSIVSSSAQSTASTSFIESVGIAINIDDQRLFVADSAQQAIIEVDITSGTRTVLASRQTPDNTLPFNRLSRIAYASWCDCIYALDFDLGVMTIDTRTGQKNVLSR